MAQNQAQHSPKESCRSAADKNARAVRALTVVTVSLAAFLVLCIALTFLGVVQKRRAADVSGAASSTSAQLYPMTGWQNSSAASLQAPNETTSAGAAGADSAETSTLPRDYTGKTLSVLGDSISAVAEAPYVGATTPVLPAAGTEEIWWQAAANSLGMSVLRVSAVSGSRTARDVADYPASAAVTRVTELSANGQNPDVIIVYMGTNDTTEADVPFGSAEETAQKSFALNGTDLPATFADAYAITLARLRILYPSAEIWCSTVLYCGTRPGVETLNGVIRDTAARWGCGLIDLYSASGINAETQYTYLPDGIHPTTETARLLGQCAATALRGA